MKNLLFLAIVLVTLVICFFPAISRFLAVIRILPEYAYLTLALIFGLLFVFLTPPGQVPDEGSHLSRSAELSEFQFSNHGKTIPASFLTLDSTFVRIHFSPDERTSQEEILSMAKIRLNPEKRHESSGPDYTVPYIPQVLGIFIGRIFTSTPLFLMYFGRLFNLLIAVVVIFFAIRITPMAKWVILLLALMPKTLFMLGSMSYDATVISCSFLLIALYLFYAYKSKELLGWKDLGLLFVISILVALCKPPYFLIGFLFLLIPVGKIGSWIKYLVVFSVFVISMLLAQGMWSLLGGLVKSADAVKTEQATHEKSTTAIPAAQPAVTGRADAAKPPAADTAGVAKTKAAEAKPQKQAFEINPGKQVNYLKTHVPEFIGLLYTTNFVRLRADMLNNFVGTMGWLDVFLPNILVDLYLALLLIAALCIAEEDAHIGWKKKVLLSGLFLIGVLAIETAMYIYSTVVGFGRLYGIQGRYFIPLAPLFLLVFYNTAIPRKLNFIFSPRRKSYEKAKPKMKPQILAEIEGEQLFTKYLQVVILLFATVVLVRGIAAVLLRYYQW